ncbi:hypothetical protein LIER_25068 [Lithospermum erythrorhizon]|uniref:Uncharacterized protein n=1 Tax=Lithospermum erythrorhizon TaxID=34254 RepID=A0AAV3R4U8_LITER
MTLYLSRRLTIHGSYQKNCFLQTLTPLKRSRYVGGVKIASPSSSPPPSERQVVALLAPKASPDKLAHDTLLPLLDERVMLRILELAPGMQVSHEVSRLWLQFASALEALADSNSGLHQQTLKLGEKLSQERFKVEALEQELHGLRLQASTTRNLFWELALLARDLKTGGEG